VTVRLLPVSNDEYVIAFPPEIQSVLERIWSTIRIAISAIEEKLRYRIPASARDDELLYFGAFKKRIGLYPPAKGDAQQRKEIGLHAGVKGDVRFPFDKRISYGLIRRIEIVRANEPAKQLAVRQRKTV